ncbi:hypothetical protein FACS189472_13840 [Alphaproteobacteria bacterium]|nr:hypothetical protein FACS189472_13840 [Alphaproteobacteria bacterium]
MRAAKLQRKNANFKARYDALFDRDMEARLGNKDHQWSVRLPAKSVGQYERGADIGIRKPVSFENGPVGFSTSSSYANINPWAPPQ